MVIDPIIAQIIGAAGYATVVMAGFNKNRIILLGVEIVGFSLIAVQWFILNAPSLAIAQLIFAYASITGSLAERHRIFGHLSLCSLPLMAFFIFTFTNTSILYGCFVLTACTFGLLAKSQTYMVRLRSLSICGSCCWFILNTYSGSIAGVMCNIGYISIHARRLSQLINGKIENLLPVIAQPHLHTLK